jgi:hypothetical protein
MKREPHVGIFWVVNGKPLIDSTPLGEAEHYGDHLTHQPSHLEVWTLLQRNGTVSREIEYEEPPRGRVVYNTKTQQFVLLADRCILQDKGIIGKIKLEMGLPKKDTELGPDSHYRCFACLRERPVE